MRAYLLCCGACCCRWCYVGHDHRAKVNVYGDPTGEEEYLHERLAVALCPVVYCRHHNHDGEPGYICFCCCKRRWHQHQDMMRRKGG